MGDGAFSREIKGINAGESYSSHAHQKTRRDVSRIPDLQSKKNNLTRCLGNKADEGCLSASPCLASHFLFEHLLNHSIRHQTRNKIITGLIRRSCYISVSAFDHNKIPKKHAEGLMDVAKGVLTKINKALESIEKELDQIVHDVGSTVEIKTFVKALTQLVVEKSGSKKLDQKADSTVETKTFVKELIQFGNQSAGSVQTEAGSPSRRSRSLMKVERLLQNPKDLEGHLPNAEPPGQKLHHQKHQVVE
ncbi:hypothetical protein MMC29_001782 [Sticta canariensis]|nr:hypothetical protein [Sticta canariensis]